jgi:hypothetical protein
VIAAHRESRAIHRNESAIRERIEGASVPALGPAGHALTVQHLIYFGGAGPHACATRFAPTFSKSFRVAAAAFEARPVPGGQRSRLVDKKQFSVEAAPDIATATLEGKHAADPLPRGPAALCKGARVGVKPPAAITHQSAARRIGKKLTERIDAILQRHCRFR